MRNLTKQEFIELQALDTEQQLKNNCQNLQTLLSWVKTKAQAEELGKRWESYSQKNQKVINNFLELKTYYKISDREAFAIFRMFDSYVKEMNQIKQDIKETANNL